MNMKLNIIVYSIMCLFALGACADDEINIYCPVYVAEQEDVYKNYELAWSEEFDVDGLPNPDIWGYEEGYVRGEEWQDYKKADLNHSRVEDGKLIIEATVDPHTGTNPWTGEPYEFGYSSASLITQNKVSFQYGRLDIAARVPRGVSLWPAIWMKPVKNINSAYVEIDIMEHVWGWDAGHNTVHSTIHTDNTWNKVKPGISNSATSNSLDTKFHLYSIVWDEKRIQLLFDNQVLVDYKKEPDFDIKDWNFDQPFFLLLNVAVGGSWGGNYGEDPSIFPKRMEVDYVRYYKKIVEDVGKDEDTGDGEEESDKNMIKNGGFEKPITELVKSGRFDKEQVYDGLNQWYGVKSLNYSVDMTMGANGTGKSMNLNFPNTDGLKWWDTDLYYNIPGVSPGKYIFSFYAKSNQTSVPLTFSIAYDETKEEAVKSYKEHKTIIFENGVQKVKNVTSGQKDVYATYVDEIGTNWKKYSVTFDIPKCEILRLVLKPYVSATAGDFNYALGKATTDLQIWMDEFSLISKPEIADQKKASILGDSYSTFYGHVFPSSNICWYGVPGEKKENDVTKVEETWWYRFIHEHDFQLECNNSYSGTTICYTGYNGSDSSKNSFIARIPDLGAPDIILVFGGTNDSWANVPIGVYQYDNWNKSDLYNFRPAFANLLSSLKHSYPNAEIYNITNSELSETITNSMDEICRHYEIKNIRLHDIEKQLGHPSVKGMRSISEQVWTAFSRQ